MNLVTNQLYREETLDTSSDEGAVSASLEKAQELVEEFIRRPLVQEERTERVTVYPTGNVYPETTPIVTADGYTIEAGGYWLSGASEELDFLRGSSGTREITYTGGYTIATLPATLREAIAWTAHVRLHAEDLAGVPPGASLVQVGDTQVSFGGARAAATGGLSEDTKKALRRWIRREP